MSTPQLDRYRRKRNFAITSEPEGRAPGGTRAALSFVIQKHAASRLHYDFRLELDGVLLSWAVPKGPSFDPKEKRMAVHVEDHPLDYGGFEGTIPPKQYGAGTVIVWDNGTWEPVGDPREGMKKGKLLFRLHGQKLAGLWELVRIRKPDDKQDPWMLFKKRDAWAKPHAEYDVVSALPDSVIAKPLGLIEAQSPSVAAAAAAQGGPSHEDLQGAVKAALPAQLKPQLGTLSKGIPQSGEWQYEVKYDGYRLMARIDGRKISMVTRGGHDWGAKMKRLVAAVEELGITSAWLDGEIVVLNEQGTPDFNALQNAFTSSKAEIVYYVFDAPFFGGYDLRRVPLVERRAMLAKLFADKQSDLVRFSQTLPAQPTALLHSACQLKLEGIMAKRVDAPYVSERTDTWLKLKCLERQEFVIAGFTERSNSSEVGALLLGVHDADGALRYAGSVGTGWDVKTGVELTRRLRKLVVDKSPFDPRFGVTKGRWSKRAVGSEIYVKPQLVAEVSFSEWTPDGSVRHASFHGLRTDKPAKAITREAAVAPTDSKAAAGAGAASTASKASAKTSAKTPASSLRISNPERVVDPSTGATKLDLVRYYESVADWILPHLKGRPVSLVRAPNGIAGEQFFQKHNDTLRIKGIKELDPALWPGHTALLEVATVDALIGAAQMNVIEFHTWNANVKKIDQPDRMIFDLDPGEGTSWKDVQEAAILTRTLLQELELESFLKTSGGKGLHIVVPLAPKYDWDTVKGCSQLIVQHLAKTIPSRFVAKSGPSNRVGKLFVDYLRNGHGATTATAFSARARPGLGVSIPVAWDQLMELKSGAHWTIATARDHLSFQKQDPWAEYAGMKQSIATAMDVIGAHKRRKR